MEVDGHVHMCGKGIDVSLCIPFYEIEFGTALAFFLFRFIIIRLLLKYVTFEVSVDI